MENPEQTERDAVRWMARRLSGEMTDAERQDFDAWLSESDENREAYEAYVIAASSLDAAEEELLTSSFEKELNALAAARDATSIPWRSIAATGLVAIVASIAFAASFFSTPGPETFATAYGQSADYTLADGSSVTLNTNSALAVDYSKSKRLVQINKGEALFNVERNPSRPFVVETRHGDITVTGTVFNVLTLAKETIISVVSGAVDISPDASPRITLLAGQRLRIGEDGRGGAIVEFNPNQALAWRDGKARYNAQPLDIVLADLNRYFQRPIVLGDPMLADLVVTGEFDIHDQQTAVNALAIAFSLEQKLEPSRVVLRKSGE